MSGGYILAIVIGLILGIINVLNEKPNTREVEGMFKTTAYHEAGHAVIAIYLGLRCYAMVLNIDKNGRLLHIQLDYSGAAYIETKFEKEIDFIVNYARGIILNTSKLPYSEELVNYAKNKLLVDMAGEITLKEIFQMPVEQMQIVDNRTAKKGEDLHNIQGILDYLKKVNHPITATEAAKEVSDIINNHKEVRAAIHFLADVMMKNPGVKITEQEILTNLKMCNFFDVYKKEMQG